MVEIKAEDGQTYEVVLYSTYRRWKKNAQIAFVLLALGATLGVWQLTNLANNNLIDKINSFAESSCLAQTKPTSTTYKYNDLVQDIIDTRRKTLLDAIESGDTAAVKTNQQAIARYESDKISIPTKEQCAVPLLK